MSNIIPFVHNIVPIKSRVSTKGKELQLQLAARSDLTSRTPAKSLDALAFHAASLHAN